MLKHVVLSVSDPILGEISDVITVSEFEDELAYTADELTVTDGFDTLEKYAYFLDIVECDETFTGTGAGSGQVSSFVDVATLNETISATIDGDLTLTEQLTVGEQFVSWLELDTMRFSPGQ